MNISLSRRLRQKRKKITHLYSKTIKFLYKTLKPQLVKEVEQLKMMGCILSHSKMWTDPVGMRVKRKGRNKQAAENVGKEWFCLSFSSVFVSSGHLRRVQWIHQTESPQRSNICSMPSKDYVPYNRHREERWVLASRTANPAWGDSPWWKTVVGNTPISLIRRRRPEISSFE